MYFLYLAYLYGLEKTVQLAELQEKYSDEYAVLSKNEHIHIKTKGNSYEIYNDISWEMLYLSDKAKAFANQTVQFSDFIEIQNLKAYSFMPVGGNPDHLKRLRSMNLLQRMFTVGAIFS